MIKFNYTHLLEIVKILYWVELAGGLDALQRVAREMADDNRGIFATIMDRHYNIGPPVPVTLNDIGKLILDHLDQEENPAQQDETLVDTIVHHLTNPYMRNALSGPVLTELQRKILSPSEQARSLQQVTKDMHCPTCGEAFVNREAVTFDPSDNGVPTFKCGKCRNARVKRCANLGCREVVATEQTHCPAHARREQVNEVGEVAAPRRRRVAAQPLDLAFDLGIVQEEREE